MRQPLLLVGLACEPVQAVFVSHSASHLCLPLHIAGAELFPFTEFFADAAQPLFKGERYEEDMEKAQVTLAKSGRGALQQSWSLPAGWPLSAVLPGLLFVVVGQDHTSLPCSLPL